MSTIQKVGVDDNNGSIVYSGAWTSIQDSSAFDGTLHRSSTVGASASLTFTGTSINIVGFVPACSTLTTTSFSVSLKLASDTGTPSHVLSKQIQCTGPAQYGVALYSSGTLTNEARTVIVQNMQDTPLGIDLFAYVYDSSGQVVDNTGQVISSQITSSTPNGGSSTSVKSSSTSSSSSDSTATESSSTVSASSKSETGTSDSRRNTGLVTASETVMVLTTINGIPTSIPVVTTPTGIAGSNGSDGTSGGSSKPSIGPIIGGIIAAILIVIILIILLLCRRRRSRVNVTMAENALESVDLFHTEPSSTMGSSANSPRTPSFASRSPFLDNPSLFSPFLDDSQSSRPESGQGTADGSSTSNNPFASSAQLDQKEPLDASESQLSTATSPARTEPTLFSTTSNSSPPAMRYSFLNRPPSSIAPSEAAPAYIQDLNNRPRYRSGLSTLTYPRLSVSHTLDIPPSYESVRNDSEPAVRPLPNFPYLPPTIIEHGQ